MVTKPSSQEAKTDEVVVEVTNVDLNRLYAKVDVTKKKGSRPNSQESQDKTVNVAVVDATYDNVPAGDNGGESGDSYAKSLIDKFNNFLETSGQEVYDEKNVN